METHNKVKVEVSAVLALLTKKLKLGEFHGDRTLLTNAAANVSTEPDALLVTWDTSRAGRIRLVPRSEPESDFIEIEGTPDWVLEIVSDSSVAKDTRRLRQGYHRAGIPEYWLIDARGEEIDFQILLREESDYAAVPGGRGGWLESRLFGRRFRLTRERNEVGRWTYTLAAKRGR
jgi:Uma2 family endonuclease